MFTVYNPIRSLSFGPNNNQNSLLDLEIALNYGQATGSAQLMRFVTEHTEVRTYSGYFFDFLKLI